MEDWRHCQTVSDAVAIEDYDLDNDLYDLNYAYMKDARKERAKQITSMKAERSKLCAMIMKCLSPARVDIINQQKKYKEQRVSKDPRNTLLLLVNQADISNVSKHFLTDIRRVRPRIAAGLSGHRIELARQGALQGFFNCYVHLDDCDQVNVLCFSTWKTSTLCRL